MTPERPLSVAELASLTYMTSREAAAYLRLSPQALKDQMRHGTIPAWCYTRLGRSLRFIRKALDQHLELQTRLDAAKVASKGGAA